MKFNKDIYNTMNSEQKKFVTDMVNAAMFIGDLKQDALIMASYQDGTVTTRVKGDLTDIVEALAKLTEAIATTSDLDVEDLINGIRYIHYSDRLEQELSENEDEDPPDDDENGGRRHS